MSRRDERRHYYILVRYAVEIAVEDNVRRVQLVVVEFDSHTAIVHKRRDFEHPHVRSRHLVKYFELFEELD